jgi:hypothetical protein
VVRKTAVLASKARKNVKAGNLQLTLRLNHKLFAKLTAVERTAVMGVRS